MTSTRRSRANSENSAAASVRHGHTVPEVFQHYAFPTTQSSASNRLEIRFLGVASLDFCNAAFYQVSETASPGQQQEDDSTSKTAAIATTPESFMYLAAATADLPPKKRRRERVLRHDVIFCLNPSAVDASVPDPDLAYYIFPHDAVVEAVNEASPFEIIFSFHATRSEMSSEDDPDEPQKYMRRRSTEAVLRRSLFESHDIVSMRITGASRGLFLSIKQTVSGFETTCRKMMQLMRRHSEQMADQRFLDIMHTSTSSNSNINQLSDTQTTTATTVSVSSHTHHHLHDNSGGHSCENNDDREMVLDEEPANGLSAESSSTRSSAAAAAAAAGLCGPSSSSTRGTGGATASAGVATNCSSSSGSNVRKCLYCGSKSTPMWRRGPQGAGTLCNACGVKWKHGKILNGNNGNAFEYSSNSGGGSRERTVKTEKKGRKRVSSGGGQRAGRRVSRSSNRKSSTKMTTDDDMETATQSLSLHDRDTSEFAAIEPHSFSSSISGSYSPVESSPSSSPPPLSAAQEQLIEKFGLDDTSFPLPDAVEAATVLTLLKRS